MMNCFNFLIRPYNAVSDAFILMRNGSQMRAEQVFILLRDTAGYKCGIFHQNLAFGLRKIPVKMCPWV